MPTKKVDFHQFITPLDYHYNPADGLWYDVDTEEPPAPITKAVFDDNFAIKFFDGNYIWDEPNVAKDFEYDATECLQGHVGGPGFTFIFTNLKKEQVCCYFQSWLLWEFDDFIRKLKAGRFAAQYIEPYSDLKLLAWPIVNNKLRIIIQCQNFYEEFYTGTYKTIDTNTQEGYKFLDSVLDLEVDKEQFITAFEQVMNQAKKALRTMIINYAEKHNLSEEKIHYLAGKMGLEPKIETK